MAKTSLILLIVFGHYQLCEGYEWVEKRQVNCFGGVGNLKLEFFSKISSQEPYYRKCVKNVYFIAWPLEERWHICGSRFPD